MSVTEQRYKAVLAVKAGLRLDIDPRLLFDATRDGETGNRSGRSVCCVALAACSVGPVKPTLPPAPPTNLRVDHGDTLGIFYTSLGQTLLVELDYPTSRDKAVLDVAGRYSNGTVFRAAAVGRTTVTPTYTSTARSNATRRRHYRSSSW